MSDGKFWSAIAFVLVLCLGVIIFSSGENQDKLAKQCAARWDGSRYPVMYDKVAKCRVQVGTRWVPEANVKVGP